MELFENTIKLRGFLIRNAEVPPVDKVTGESLSLLTLATVSGAWDLADNEWHPRTDVHRIFCDGPYFCGLVRGMRRGDYVEVEGELRDNGQIRAGAVADERFPVECGLYGIHATRVTRLERPEALVDYGEDA